MVEMQYWVSSRKATFWVGIDSSEKIVDTAPIARKFIGQPFKNLLRYFNIDRKEQLK
jgi:hypothetical protein